VEGYGPVIGLYRDCLDLAQFVLELEIFQTKVVEFESWKFLFLSKEPDIPFQILDFRAYNIKNGSSRITSIYT
jgi:hypothetical protein